MVPRSLASSTSRGGSLAIDLMSASPNCLAAENARLKRKDVELGHVLHEDLGGLDGVRFGDDHPRRTRNAFNDARKIGSFGGAPEEVVLNHPVLNADLAEPAPQLVDLLCREAPIVRQEEDTGIGKGRVHRRYDHFLFLLFHPNLLRLSRVVKANARACPKNREGSCRFHPGLGGPFRIKHATCAGCL